MSKPTEKEPCITFEQAYPTIQVELAKKRHRWLLTSLNWLDYEDVCQVIMFHIFKKLHLYDCKKSLVPWLSTIISNQIKNLIRNHYGNYSRPCLRCDAAEGETGCKIYKKQCSGCPLYAEWERKKLPAQNIKLPVSIENHPNETNSLLAVDPDLSEQINKVHIKMKQILKPAEYKVYEGLFILEEDEGVVARRLGYIANEKDRTGRFKQIQNIRKIIIVKIKRAMTNGEIDLL